MKTGPFNARRGEQSDEALKDAALHFARTLAQSINDRDDVRAFVHTFAAWLAEETRTPRRDRDRAGDARSAPASSSYGTGRSSDSGPVRTTGDTARQDADSSSPTWKAAEYSSFDVIERRAALKAETCRWKVEKRSLEDAGDDAEPSFATYDSLIDRAKALPNCYLWMVQWSELPDDDVMHDIAGCYDNLAAMARTIGRWFELRDAGDAPAEEMLLLAAETQSALRAALLRADFQDDRDQNDMFFWLREQAETYGIYIARFMRKTDQADPTEWQDLRTRINAYADVQEASVDGDKRRASLINTVRYHVGQLVENGFDEADEDHHWNRIFQSCVAWVEAGFSAADADFCRCVVPVFDQVPEDLNMPNAAEDVFRTAEDIAEVSDDDDTDDDDEDIDDAEEKDDDEQPAVKAAAPDVEVEDAAKVAPKRSKRSKASSSRRVSV